jgi:hypothetical protein
MLLYRTFHSASKQAYYKGSFKMGKMDGKGYRAGPEGDIYEGEWKEDKRHGTGTQVWANGSRYTGEWYDDKRHGSGKHDGLEGVVYEGDWEDNKYHGHGKYVSNEGTYIGDWVEGLKDGQGSLESANGSRFAGQWRANKPHGLGMLVQSGYEGVATFWADGKPDGGKGASPDIQYPWDSNGAGGANPQHEPPSTYPIATVNTGQLMRNPRISEVLTFQEVRTNSR